jgi:ketosteroid isomerase-like protein
MDERSVYARLIADLHAARVRGDLPAICRCFSETGTFRIAGASEGKPIAVTAEGLQGFRPWLAMMVKAFRVTDYQLLALVIDGARGSAHWSARIHSKITGITVPTELVDLTEFRDGKIVAYTEFFVPR